MVTSLPRVDLRFRLIQKKLGAVQWEQKGYPRIASVFMERSMDQSIVQQAPRNVESSPWHDDDVTSSLATTRQEDGRAT